MGYKITKHCPICNQEFRAWSTDMEWGLRYHIDNLHPQQAAEILAAEKEVKTIQDRLHSKYPAVGIFGVHMLGIKV